MGLGFFFLGNFFFPNFLFSHEPDQKLIEHLYHGNRLHQEGAFEEAYGHYTKALILIRNSDLGDNFKKKELSRLVYRMTLLSLFLDREEEFLHLILDGEKLQFQNLSLLGSKALDNEQSLFLTGWAHYKKKRFEEAKEIFSRIQQGSPFFDLKVYFLAQIECGLGHPEKAISTLESFPETDQPLSLEMQLLRGDILMRINCFKEASSIYEKGMGTLPAPPLSMERLHNYIYCCFQLIDTHPQSLSACRQNLLTLLLTPPFNKRKIHALAYYHLLMGKTFGQKESFIIARQLLKGCTPPLSADLLLLKAEAAENIEEALSQTQAVLDGPQADIEIRIRSFEQYGKLAYLIAGHSKKAGERKKAVKELESAKQSFRKACALSRINRPRFHPGNLEWLIHISITQGTDAAYDEARDDLDSLPPDYPVDWKAYFNVLLFAGTGKEGFEGCLKTLTDQHSQSPLTPKALYMAAAFYYRSGNWEKAEELFGCLASEYPSNKLAPNALYFQINTKKQLNEDTRPLIQRLYTLYPASDFAAEHYLEMYEWGDYAQGNPAAAEHLDRMAKHFPLSPYLIEAHYLSGLDLNRDLKTDSGKLIRKEKPDQALLAFEEGENLFLTLKGQERIPLEEEDYFYMLFLRCRMDRALTLLRIAEQSSETKQRIHYEYATDVLNQLMKNIEEVKSRGRFTDLWEEAQYVRAKISLKLGRLDLAKKLFSNNLEELKERSVTRGYFLSRTHYRLGLIAMQEKGYEEALIAFEQANDAAKGDVLSTHQKLDLWIRQSLCYQALDEDKKAMKILSKVINEDAASNKRLQAMYLRSEIYLRQGRKELAVKQLESLSLKGGRWGGRARKKLLEL